MGFDPIYLVGVDVSSEIPPTAEQFDSNTFNNDLIEGYKDIRRCVESRGRYVFDATVGGKLEVFERVSINSLF